MYSKLQLAVKYLNYYLTASNGKGHGIHSPFVFEFITKVLNDGANYATYGTVEKMRDQLENDKSILNVEDFGAGSVVSKKNQRTVSSIARSAAKPKKYGQLLFRMIKFYRPTSILEMGTSLGITTSYLALADPGAKVITLEGSPEVATIAKNNLNNLAITNAEVVEGNFDSKLSSVLAQLSCLDFAFVDGNHRKEPTERYFEQLLTRISNDSILVFDDIHWSREMEGAWNTITHHSSVTCTIDLFFIGIALFRKEFKEKQHFMIRF